jgi:hypothetical protein
VQAGPRPSQCPVGAGRPADPAQQERRPRRQRRAMVFWAFVCLVPLLVAAAAGADAEGREAALLAWVGSDGFESPVTIGETEFGRGLVLTRDVPKDSMLLFVPQDKALSLESCTMAPAYKQALRLAAEQQNKLAAVRNYVLVALALLYERSLGAASRFAPYVNTLPQEPPRNLFSWSSDQIDLAIGLLGADKVPKTAARCPDDVRQALADLAAKESGWFDKLTWATDVSDDLAAWACSMAFSRNFNGELMPLVRTLRRRSNINFLLAAACCFSPPEENSPICRGLVTRPRVERARQCGQLT